MATLYQHFYLKSSIEKPYCQVVNLDRSGVVNLERSEVVNLLRSRVVSLKRSGVVNLSVPSTQIMNSNSSERSFARSLLALLKGGSYAFDVLPNELPAEPRVKSQLKLENEYFRISPNPAKDYIEVWVKNSNMFETLELVNLSGTVTQRQSIKGKSNIKFELSDCISGSYFIKAIDTDNKVLQIKQFEIIK